MKMYQTEKQAKVLGPNHRYTLSSLNRLAGCYRDIGQVEKAISIYQDVSEKRAKVLGPNHRDTLSSLEQVKKAISVREDAL